MSSGPDENDYEATCNHWAKDRRSQWDELKAALWDRPGWHFEIDHRGFPIWRFGLEGAERLVVTVGFDGLIVYDNERDRDHLIFHTRQLVEWLARHEHEYAGFTPLQERLATEQLRHDVDSFGDQEGGEES